MAYDVTCDVIYDVTCDVTYDLVFHLLQLIDYHIYHYYNAVRGRRRGRWMTVLIRIYFVLMCIYFVERRSGCRFPVERDFPSLSLSLSHPPSSPPAAAQTSSLLYCAC